MISQIQIMLLPRVHTLLSRRLFRFFVFGASAAARNVILMLGFVDGLGWNTTLLRNLANVVSVELSLLYSFIVYRLFVWQSADSDYQVPPTQQLFRYHASAGTAIVTRSFLLFPLFDICGVHHVANTIVGVGVSCLLNYALSSRFVFTIAEAEAGVESEST